MNRKAIIAAMEKLGFRFAGVLKGDIAFETSDDGFDSYCHYFSGWNEVCVFIGR